MCFLSLLLITSQISIYYVTIGHYTITELIHVDNFSIFRCLSSNMSPDPAKSSSSKKRQLICNPILPELNSIFLCCQTTSRWNYDLYNFMLRLFALICLSVFLYIFDSFVDSFVDSFDSFDLFVDIFSMVASHLTNSSPFSFLLARLFYSWTFFNDLFFSYSSQYLILIIYYIYYLVHSFLHLKSTWANETPNFLESD